MRKNRTSGTDRGVPDNRHSYRGSLILIFDESVLECLSGLLTTIRTNSKIGGMSMSIENAAKVFLSGEHSRRRGYLLNIMNQWDRLAIMGTIAIWAFLVKLDVLNLTPPQNEQLAIQVGWASTVSSILLGLWRVYAHWLDRDIIRLYPGVYLYERVLNIPEQLSLIDRPENTEKLSKEDIHSGVVWEDIYNHRFGHRGHQYMDLIACIIIILFGILSVVIARSLNAVIIVWMGEPHIIGYLLWGNFIGLLLVSGSYLWWRYSKCPWPIPNSSSQQQESSKA